MDKQYLTLKYTQLMNAALKHHDWNLIRFIALNFVYDCDLMGAKYHA